MKNNVIYKHSLLHVKIYFLNMLEICLQAQYTIDNKIFQICKENIKLLQVFTNNWLTHFFLRFFSLNQSNIITTSLLFCSCDLLTEIFNF